MAELVAATAIVLAGGSSSRFGSDKLTADLNGEPLLHHAIRAVAGVCTEILVVGPPTGLPSSLPDAPAAMRVILDRNAHQGPLVALAQAAREAAHDRLLLVAGDMPELQGPVLRRLLAWREGRAGACLVVGIEAQPIPAGLDRRATAERGGFLVQAGERSLKALIGVLDMERVPEAGWRALDPEGRSLHDIDRPGDLAAM